MKGPSVCSKQFCSRKISRVEFLDFFTSSLLSTLPVFPPTSPIWCAGWKVNRTTVQKTRNVPANTLGICQFWQVWNMLLVRRSFRHPARLPQGFKWIVRAFWLANTWEVGSSALRLLAMCPFIWPLSCVHAFDLNFSALFPRLGSSLFRSCSLKIFNCR